MYACVCIYTRVCLNLVLMTCACVCIHHCEEPCLLSLSSVFKLEGIVCVQSVSQNAIVSWTKRDRYCMRKAFRAIRTEISLIDELRRGNLQHRLKRKGRSDCGVCSCFYFKVYHPWRLRNCRKKGVNARNKARWGGGGSNFSRDWKFWRGISTFK